jgi:hypothetical protein
MHSHTHDSEAPARGLALQAEALEALDAAADEAIHPYVVAVGPFGTIVGLGIGAVAIT